MAEVARVLNNGVNLAMSPVIQMILGLASCAFFVGLMVSKTSTKGGTVCSQDDVIDPHNSYQLGFLMGMTGGTITDAAVVRYALERFEKTHGYKPTLRDAALVIGLMNSGHEW